MIMAAGPFGLGPLELGIILLVIVMLFGATRLADIGGSLGKGIREFRKNVKDDEADAADQAETPPQATASTAGGAETIAAVKCPSCGALNVATAKHCTECGASIVTPVS